MVKCYNSDITDILEARQEYELREGRPAVFLSDWDISSDIPSIEMELYTPNEYLRDYKFWTNESNERLEFQQFIQRIHGIRIGQDEFLIAANGTAAISLALEALHDLNKRHFLVVTPVYFTIVEKLIKLDSCISEFPLSLINGFHFELDNFTDTIISQRIEVVVLTLPYFGTGVPPTLDCLKSIVEICRKRSILLLVLSRLLRKFQQAAAGRRHCYSFSRDTSRSLLEPHSQSSTN